MSTRQNYVGRGTNASPTEQTATTATQTANSTAQTQDLADNRQRQFYEAQTKLLDLVDGFVFEEAASGPIELINDLLYHWLTTPAIDDILPDMTIQANRDRLDRAFELVNFLAKAYELQGSYVHYGRLMQEVSNG